MAINLTTMPAGAHELGIQRSKLPVYDCGSESGNLVLTFSTPMRELFIANDSETESITVVVSCHDGDLTFALLNCETLDERFQEFLTVTVTSAGNWRWIVRSGRVN